MAGAHWTLTGRWKTVAYDDESREASSNRLASSTSLLTSTISILLLYTFETPFSAASPIHLPRMASVEAEVS